MFRDSILAVFRGHEVPRDEEALPPLLLDKFLGILGVGLLLGEVDNRDVCALPGEQDGNGTPDS